MQRLRLPVSLCTVLMTLVVTSPMVMAAQSTICPPSCAPFGQCVPCYQPSPEFCEYCLCNFGYEGDDCSLRVDDCPAPLNGIANSVDKCYNGGKCVVKEVVDDGTGGTAEVWRCDCTTAVGSAAFPLDPVQHAGAKCEFPATRSCLVGGADSTYAFCVNKGDCARQIVRGEAHPGCICRDGYAGRHCQYLEGDVPPEELEAARIALEGDENGMKPGFIVVFVLLGCVVLGCLAMAVRKKGFVAERKADAVAHATEVPTDLNLEETAEVSPAARDSGEEDVEDQEPTEPKVV